MRTSLLVSTLFAASLLTGAALADDHHQVQFGRSHGDTMDKSYKAQKSDSTRGNAASRTATGARSMVQQKANERINCSNDGADCSASHGSKSARSNGSTTAAAANGRSAMRNPLEQKGSDRVNCNEGDECSASSKGSKAVWAKSRAGASPAEATPLATQAMAASNRKMNQAYEARMSCNEGDECSFSSKEAKKIWRLEAFKHGTAAGAGNDFTNPSAALKAQMEKARYKSDDAKK